MFTVCIFFSIRIHCAFAAKKVTTKVFSLLLFCRLADFRKLTNETTILVWKPLGKSQYSSFRAMYLCVSFSDFRYLFSLLRAKFIHQNSHSYLKMTLQAENNCVNGNCRQKIVHFLLCNTSMFEFFADIIANETYVWKLITGNLKQGKQMPFNFIPRSPTKKLYIYTYDNYKYTRTQNNKKTMGV